MQADELASKAALRIVAATLGEEEPRALEVLGAVRAPSAVGLDVSSR